MPRIKKLTALEDIIIEAYLNGTSLENLATNYNVSPGTIRNILKRRGIMLRKQGRKPNDYKPSM